VPERNWHRIDKAPRAIGPLLLRAGTGPSDPAYVGYQVGRRWFSGDVEVQPTHYCEIPLFDADESAGGEPSA
jgi:hypothetical protein